jgi:hypothetical protein
MRLPILLTTSLFALALCAPVRAADTDDHSADTILKIEHDWIVASQCGGTAYVQALLADDYKDLSYDSPAAKAEVSGKDDGGASHPKPDCMQHLPHQEDVHVELYGDTAVASGTGVLPATATRPERRFHFLDVYHYTGGHWHAVFSEDMAL